MMPQDYLDPNTFYFLYWEHLGTKFQPQKLGKLPTSSQLEDCFGLIASSAPSFSLQRPYYSSAYELPHWLPGLSTRRGEWGDLAKRAVAIKWYIYNILIIYVEHIFLKHFDISQIM
jgi:hypothetical protein